MKLSEKVIKSGKDKTYTQKKLLKIFISNSKENFVDYKSNETQARRWKRIF